MNTNESNPSLVRPTLEFPHIAWGGRDVLWAIVLAACGIILLNLATVALSLLLGIPIRDDSALLMILVIVQDIIIVGAAWTFSVLRYRIPWKHLGLRQFDVAFGCLFSAALFGLSYFIRLAYIWVAMTLGWQLRPQDVIARLDVSGWNFWLTLFSVSVLAPVAEEIFFRGFMYGGLRARLGVMGAMLTSTLFFTALHFSLDAFIPIFVLGLFLAWLYEKTGSLYPGILMHATNNGIAIIALFIAQTMGIPLPQ